MYPFKTVFRVFIAILIISLETVSIASNLQDVPPPPIPTAKAATGIGPTGFTANWGSSTGATKYYLDVAKNSSFTTFVTGYQNLDVGNVTSRGVTGLSAATTYYYRVRATNSSGTSGSSGTITVTTQSAIPPAPVASAATSITQTTFTANWGSSTGATKYYLDVAKNSSFTSYVSGYQNLDVGNVTSRGVTGLSAATTYYYRIRAANSSGTSGNSGTITVTTQSAIPVPPTSISVSGITQGGFIVSWGAVSGATSYFVDVATNSSFTSYVPGFNNLEIFYNLTTVTVRGLDPQKTYYFRIRSKNSYGISQNSSTSPVTTSPATYGVTILVHGYVLEGMEDAQSSERKNSSTNTAYDPVSYWGTNNIVGIQQRMGGGLVYKYDKQSLSFVNITDIVSAFKVNKNANGEKILIFDWSESSNDNASYHAEAAAEALFLALVKGNFVNISPQSTNPKIHFISHSRGTVVTSECVQRLGYYNVPVNYVTYLDPHDFDENWIPFDDFFHDPAVQVWDNIRYADNFWQLASGIIGGTLNPSGRSIEQLVSGYNYNRQLDDLNGFGNNGSHGLVKDYYFGTVIPGSKDNTWYTDKTGANTGLSLWLSLGGHSYTGNANCFNPSLPRTNAKTLANLIRYTTNSTNNDDDFAKPSISNSGFFSPDQGIPNSSNNIGGWSYFGGGYYSNSVTPALKFENGAMAFDCSSLTPTGSTYELTHNWVQVPYYNCNLSFQYKISRASSTLNSCKVKVYLITQENTQVLLWELALNSTTSWVTKTFSMSAYLNKRIKIKLVYVKESSTVTAARVEFDNFDIVGLSMDNDLVLHEILDEVLPEGSLTQPDRSLKKSNNLLDKEISEPEEAIKKNGIDKNNANPPDLKGSDMSSKIELESLHSRAESAPVSFMLHQNYPNPFNPVTTIKYTIPEDGFVSLRIFTPEGVEIANLVSDIQRAGEHTVLFNASNLPSGVYFYKLESGTKSFVKKLMLLK